MANSINIQIKTKVDDKEYVDLKKKLEEDKDYQLQIGAEVDDKEIKFHHTTSMNDGWHLEKALMEEVKKFNEDYYIILRDLVYGNKNKYLYEVVW